MAKRLRKKQVTSLIVTILSVSIVIAQQKGWLQSATQVAQTNQPGLYSVTSFSDGDTIQVDMNGKKETIRFIGVDTPETHDPRKAVQCFGQAAAKFTHDLIGEKGSVRLEADPLSTNRDRYDRLLRYVYLPDGRLVEAEIIGQGYGFAYTSFPFTKSDEFRALERQAREQNKGLWGSCTPAQNQYGGYTSNDAQ
jgi:endonuclease YncB( thermonuclease family)